MTEARATGPRATFAPDASLTVLFYSDAPYEGGAERYVDYLVGELPATWSVGAVVRRDARLDAWARRLAAMGVRVFRAPAADVPALRALWKAVREMHPDVVHINMPHSYSAHYTAAAPVARLAGARAVVTTEHLTMFTPMRARGLLRRTLTRSVDRIVTLTRSNHRDLVERHRMPARKIVIVANGVPDAPAPDAATRASVRASVGVAPGDVMLLHVAALTERKGHAFLVEALGRIDPTGWRLVLVGEGEEEPSLRRRVAERGLDAHVTFAGRRDPALPLVHAADVVLLPSRIEGMPLTLLEALACGRPAITTRIYGIPEIYEGSEAARLVPWGDVESLAAALTALIDDPARRARMGREARRLYETRHTAREMAARTEDVYRDALGGRGVKILVVKPHLPLPPTQGTRRLTLGLLRDLASAFDVHFLCMLESREEARHVAELEAMGITVRAPLAPNRRSPLHRAWFRVRNDSMAFLTGYPREYYYAAPALLGRALEAWTREVAFDVVVLEYWKLAHLAARVRSGRPVVLAHDAEFVVRDRRRTQTEEGGRPLTAWRLRREASREIDALRDAETILALTAQDRRDLSGALGDARGEIHVLPVGTDLRPGPGRDSAPDTVGFVGSFKADFNVDALRYLLDQIWPRVRRARPDARLLVAGGDLPPELEVRGGSAGVTFLGYVEDLPGFIESVRAFAVPLRYGGGLRIRLVEALTVGAAVVSTPVGTAGLELEPERHYLEAAGPDAFAESLVRVLEDDALREHLVATGRAEAMRRYGREPVRRRTIELFENLGARRTAA